ncbi:MAG: PA14 domain-containing protein [Bacteroidota bacterium]
MKPDSLPFGVLESATPAGAATETAPQPLREPAVTDRTVGRRLLTLALALAFGLVVVWQLRQEWAKTQIWPWFFLLAVAWIAAVALRGLESWLPGQPVFPRLEAFASTQNVVLGALGIAGGAVLVALVAWRLWPDTQKWQATPLPWITALLLIVIGSWLLGGTGRGSPRAATALRLWTNSSRNRRLEAGAFLLILALAIFLRTYRLNTIPPGIYVDETNGALDALHILEGRPDSPFGTGWYGTPNGYLYYMAGIFKLLGANWYSLKLISLLPAILTVPAIYLLARLMFGPGAGLIAMLLLAVSRWHLSLSRWGWNETAPPLFQILSTYFLIRGLRDRRALDYALSGLLTGLSLYTYLSARLAAATLLLYVVFWFLSDPSGLIVSLRRSWLGLVIMAVAALATFAPLGVTYATNPFVFSDRVSEISVMKDIRQQNSFAPLVQNIGDILKFFHQTGDHQGKHNLPDEPMTDPVTGLLFAVGLLYAIIAWRDQRSFLLLAWLVLGLAGSFLSSHSESPQSYRALTALPAVVLMAADVLDRAGRGVYRVVQERPGLGHGSAPARVAGSVVLLALAGSAFWESGVYFGRQATSMDVVRGFNPTENGVAREVTAALHNDTAVYLSPRFSDYSPLRFLVYGEMKRQTGRNSLDDPPYHVVLPEVNLPVPDTGQDVLILLDSVYWPLRGYIASFYPNAQMDLVSLSDGSTLYMRVRVPRAQVAALQGLAETLTFPDGRKEGRVVTAVGLGPGDAKATEIDWDGAIRLEHGGQYELRGEGGLEVYLDDVAIEGPHYLGRGLYGLRVIWRGGDSDQAKLTWRVQDQDAVPVPAQALFRISGPQQGLLGRYWRNTNWENEPVFHQVTPFLLLAWPDEQPLVPDAAFTARYTGWLHVTEAGTYTFRIEADDGARLVLDGNVLGEGLAAGQPNTFEASLDLAAGDHPIQIDYIQQGGGSALRFFWQKNGGPLLPVPPSALIPAKP